MQWIQSGGVRLACRVRGPEGAPTLVLVHGYPDSSRIWEPLVSQLAERYRIVTYDVRGSGRSDVPSGIGAYRLRQLLGDFQAVINHFSPDEPVHLIGHDWGAIQSWEAATEPALAHRIASFTPVSGPCLDHVGLWLRERLRQRGWQDIKNLLRQARSSWYIGLFHFPVLAPGIWRLGLGEHWPRVIERLEQRPVPPDPDQTRQGAVGVNLYRANTLPRLRHPRTRVSQVPVHLIMPEDDPFVSASLFDELEHWVPCLQRTLLAGGHWVPLSQPSQLAFCIARFVDAIEAA